MNFVTSVKRTKAGIELYRYEGADLEPQDQGTLELDVKAENTIPICFLDLETTGINRSADKIIELAVKLVRTDRRNGQVLDVLNAYEAFEDPGFAIPEEITLINGITTEMVAEQHIQADRVQDIFSRSQLVVAHNAAFDRAFMDRYYAISRKTLWACSLADIDWLRRGFPNQKQELLCLWHGFYYESHRAMQDVNALIHLLTHPHYQSGNPLQELLSKAWIPTYRIKARDCPFDLKERVKANFYSWNAQEKVWWKDVPRDKLEAEKKWLLNNIYGTVFRGEITELPLVDKYKD